MKNGNPAVVGLAGFGMTTFLLQLHNLGLVGWGPVLGMGIIFGGLAQLIAGFQEQKMGITFTPRSYYHQPPTHRPNNQRFCVVWCFLDRTEYYQTSQPFQCVSFVNC
jgi:hypothetical protein